jgi:hypothetical protein
MCGPSRRNWDSEIPQKFLFVPHLSGPQSSPLSGHERPISHNPIFSAMMRRVRGHERPGMRPRSGRSRESVAEGCGPHQGSVQGSGGFIKIRYGLYGKGHSVSTHRRGVPDLKKKVSGAESSSPREHLPPGRRAMIAASVHPVRVFSLQRSALHICNIQEVEIQAYAHILLFLCRS